MATDVGNQGRRRVRNFICAGYFLTKMVSNFSLLPSLRKIVTVSTFITDTLPNTWALRWVIIEDSEREGAARAWGLNETSTKQFVAWTTEQWQAGNIGWPNVLMSLKTSADLLKTFRTEEINTARLVGLGLHRQMLTGFLKDTGSQGEGLGCVGVRQCLRRGANLPTNGRILGYDVLQLDVTGDFDSWLRYWPNDPATGKPNIKLGSNGLLQSYSTATLCAEYASKRRMGLEPWTWYPWMVVDYGAPGRLRPRERLRVQR